jgi:single-strand DNA-binding protein
MRYMPDGTAVCNLSVATTRTWKDKAGQSQKATTWFRVDVWGKMAEVCHQYLTKGRQVQVVGELRGDENGGPRVYETKNGEHRASFELRASNVTFLGHKSDDTATPDEDEDDDPF